MDLSPNGRESERALIGAVLRKPATFANVADAVNVDDFHWQPYADAWAAFTNLHRAGMRIDALTVADELNRMGKLGGFMEHDAPGMTGPAALSTLRENGDPLSVTTYADNVADYAAKRKLEKLSHDLVYWSRNGRRAFDIISDLTQITAEIKTPGKAESHTASMKEAIRAAANHTYDAAEGKVAFLELGYPDLDKIIDGIMPTDFWIIAGRPGDGKTALLASAAKNIAESGKRVLFFTLEMSNSQIAMRWLAMESGVPFGKQKTGQMTESDWDRYNRAVEKLGDENYPVIFNDLPSIKISQIRREMRRVGKVDVVFLDYIQLAGSDEDTENRTQEVSKISRGIAELAKEFQTPFICAAQLSRESEKRTGKRPILSDLRESGSLEQDACGVMFIHRADKLSPTAEIIVAKNRFGPVNQCQLFYNGPKTRYESIAKEGKI